MPNDAPRGDRQPVASEAEKLRQAAGALPKEMTDAARLMAQPLAGAAALSALGVGMATQAFGFWLSAMSSVMEASHRIAHAGEGAGSAPERTPDPKPAAARAKATVDSLIAEARTVASADANVVKLVTKAERAAKAAKPAARKPLSTRAAAASRKPVAAPRAPRSDDLKAIGGVGPKLESVLNGLGYRTYAQIAALTADQIAAIEDHVGFKGRIERDGWIAQAKALMAGGSA